MELGSRFLAKCKADFLVQSYICDKIFMKFQSVFPEVPVRAKLWKNALSSNVEKSFKKFLYPDPEEDDFQNLIISSLSRDTSMAKVSRRFVQ